MNPVSLFNLAEATTIPLDPDFILPERWMWHHCGAKRHNSNVVNLSLSLFLSLQWLMIERVRCKKIARMAIDGCKGSWQKSWRLRDWFGRRHIIICNWWPCRGMTIT
jgi:hypothetical protein